MGQFGHSSGLHMVALLRHTTDMDAEELVRRRKALNIGSLALAREVGVAESTMWRWERGKSKPSGLSLRQLETTLRRLERRKGIGGER